MVVPAQLTAEAANQLREGIDLLLSRWSALQMAVQNEWGGRDTCQKAQRLAVDIFYKLTQPAETLYIDDLEDFLDDFMLSLNTEIGDGSIEEISENLMVMHEECLGGNFASIERLRQPITQNAAFSHQIQAVNGGEDDSDSTSASGNESVEMAENPDSSEVNSNLADMTIGEPAPVPAIEPDGWTIVSRRNRGGRR